MKENRRTKTEETQKAERRTKTEERKNAERRKKNDARRKTNEVVHHLTGVTFDDNERCHGPRQT